LVIAVVLPLGARTNYKKWLDEEVVWIISQKERDTVRSLKTDEEREEFIQEFWKRRDPTPATPRNEYKDEHYRRFQYAIKSFQEGVPGWRTDRGRIYIIHGPPAKENFYTSNSWMNVDGRVDNRSRTPNTMVWTYNQNPNAKNYKGEIGLVFKPSGGLWRQNLALGESKTAQDKADELNRQLGPATDQNMMEADVRYRLIIAGPPALVTARGAEIPTAGLGEAAQYLEDLFRSPGEIFEASRAKSEEKERARKQMREAVAAHLSFGSLPIALSTREYVLDNGNYRVQVQLDIPKSDLADYLGKTKSAEATSHIDLYCALVDGQTTLIDEFVDSMDISPSMLAASSSDMLHYLNYFHVPQGNYILKAAMRSSGAERLGYSERPLHIFRDGDKLALSELLVTEQVRPLVDSSASSGEAVVMGNTLFLPNPGRKFTSSDRLFVYFQIFLPKGKDLQDCDLSVGANVIAGDQIVGRLDPRKVTEKNSSLPGVINFATSLSLEHFALGNYILQVQVFDHTSRKFSIQRTEFTVGPHN